MNGPFEILNYQIIRKIGEGGMGQVYLAKNKNINQFVAIKMLHPRFANNAILRDRFRQEAIMLSSLNHPGIVQFLNYVENEQGIFLIMEYVDGMTLEDYINKRTGLIVESKAVPMMNEILDAFAYAHGRGVVHRDIKPSNILITNEGSIKVLDFGIAQIISESGEEGDTKAGSVEYMSPEQTRGQHLDIRSDIYSLGVLFYQMLTGRSPYDINSLSSLEIRRSIVEQPLARMKEIYPHVSDGMQYFVDQATQKNPARRFRNCKDMKTCLNRVAQQDLDGETDDSGNINRGNSKKRSSKGLIISICAALAVIILGGAALWIYLRNSVRYYDDYTENNTIPVGLNVGSSSNKNAPKYKLEFSKGKLDRLMLVDANGNKVAGGDSLFAVYHPSEIEYLYKENGELDSRKVYDSEGKLLYELKYEDGLYSAKVERAQADSSSFPAVRLIFNNADGRVEKINYENGKGKKTAYNGVYGEAYEYDKNDRLSRVTFIDANDKPAANNMGVAKISFDYSKGPSDVKSSLFDVSGNPVTPVVSRHEHGPYKNKKTDKSSKKDRHGRQVENKNHSKNQTREIDPFNREQKPKEQPKISAKFGTHSDPSFENKK